MTDGFDPMKSELKSVAKDQPRRIADMEKHARTWINLELTTTANDILDTIPSGDDVTGDGWTRQDENTDTRTL